MFKGGNDQLRNEKIAPVVINKATCEVLFCDYTASILVASADKGEYAVSDDKLRSLFTYNFAKSLKRLIKHDVGKSAG